MKLRTLAVGVAILLCTALTGTPTAADHPQKSPDQAAPDSQPPADANFVMPIPDYPPGYWEKLLSEGNEPRPASELEEAIRMTEQDSSVVNFYPDEPEDPTLNPPLLDAEGKEVIGTPPTR